jgi:hypothetical protein
MKRLISLISLIILINACDRFPDPAYEILKNYYFVFQNPQGQRFLEGEWVNDSILFSTSTYSESGREKIRVKFDILMGGGNVTANEAYTDSFGNVKTKWQLGSASFQQILRATSYDMSGNYLTSTDLTAYGFRTGQWNAWNGNTDGNIMGMVADTVNKVTFMVTNNTVFRQGERYYLWEALTDPLISSARTINIDKNGIIYVTTWNGTVAKSTDHGATWTGCTKPYPARPYFVYISVSNDNYLWVYDLDDPIKFSADGGTTWTNAGVGMTGNGYRDVFRLKDGSLLFHGSDCCSLFRSTDNGTTWSTITAPGYTQKLFVNDADEIFTCAEGDGMAIYKSDNYGATFTLVNKTYPEWGGSMENTFTRWGNFYYILIPGYGILKSSDLIHYEDYWVNSRLMDLFIDHNGVLIAKDMNYNIVYYRKN